MQDVDKLSQEQDLAKAERDLAIQMLADWCVAVSDGGPSWDNWDCHYKEAMYKPGPLRARIDTAIARSYACREAMLRLDPPDAWDTRAEILAALQAVQAVP